MQVKPVSCILYPAQERKTNVPLAKKLDTWFESAKGLRMEGKREEVNEEKRNV